MIPQRGPLSLHAMNEHQRTIVIRVQYDVHTQQATSHNSNQFRVNHT